MIKFWQFVLRVKYKAFKSEKYGNKKRWVSFFSIIHKESSWLLALRKHGFEYSRQCWLLLSKIFLINHFLKAWFWLFLAKICSFSTTPFCWGVLIEEKLWEMPFSLQKFSKTWFSNSPPWLDLMNEM